ncbi:dipeptidase PepE [Mucilaginibacter sp. E4BP6]|uniref:dipeptidase PepE n=1 Tax=Mucilaginibacter sp. E4BP6 TaxID=2723089 RepID=UPI0015C8F810|nr:dipeptidase PepE [Mucilaginibacter sp. E4BP6]NYE64563.1 dipeptidase E [Mucilaginibacter sp. E4BP6]
MKNILLASTSAMSGEDYLAYLKPSIANLFSGVDEIIFIPFARPGGISHDDYTKKVAGAFSVWDIRVTGLHTFEDSAAAVLKAKGFFTGGGNTFLLVKTLHELDLMNVLKETVEKGAPYLGTSAGSNIGGLTMHTTNDMPIVLPPSLNTMGLVPFNLNPHYLDPDPDSKHNGETRETRINEFHTQHAIPVIGLREGSWIRVQGETVTTEGLFTSRIFEQGRDAYEVAPGNQLLF